MLALLILAIFVEKIECGTVVEGGGGADICSREILAIESVTHL